MRQNPRVLAESLSLEWPMQARRQDLADQKFV